MGDGSQELTLLPAASLGINTLAGVQFKRPMACPQPPVDSLSAIELPRDGGFPFDKGCSGYLGSSGAGE